MFPISCRAKLRDRPGFLLADEFDLAFGADLHRHLRDAGKPVLGRAKGGFKGDVARRLSAQPVPEAEIDVVKDVLPRPEIRGHVQMFPGNCRSIASRASM